MLFLLFWVHPIIGHSGRACHCPAACTDCTQYSSASSACTCLRSADRTEHSGRAVAAAQPVSCVSSGLSATDRPRRGPGLAPARSAPRHCTAGAPRNETLPLTRTIFNFISFLHKKNRFYWRNITKKKELPVLLKISYIWIANFWRYVAKI